MSLRLGTMISPHPFKLLSLVFFSLVPIILAITECPSGESITTGTSGAKYALCPTTDFQGASPQILNNVADLAACVSQCDNNGACRNAVYDRAGRICHIKTNAVGGLAWVVDARFDVVRLRNDVPEGENIARCSYAESSYTGNGKTYKICRGTDLKGASAQIVNNVANANACAQRCSTTIGCVKAVFDNINLVCHIKAPEESSTLIWVMNKQFTVLRQDSITNPATAGRWSDLIRFPVIPVAGYVVPDLSGATRLLIFSSWGADAFGGASGLTQ